MFARLAVATVCALAPLTWVGAQTAPATPSAGPPPDVASPPLDPKQNQKIERIHVEDKNATVDELRVGGRTQSIDVKPRGDAPAYEVTPADSTRQRHDSREAGSGSNGPRVWNVLKF